MSWKFISGVPISVSSSYWTSQSKLLLARMDALGELPSVKQQKNIADTVKALENLCLFDRRFDALWVMRGYGLSATKLNWIKDAHNLTKGGAGTLVYADGVGYKTDGTTYLNTNYNVSTEKVNRSLYDGSIGIKLGGTVGSGCAFGAYSVGNSSTNLAYTAGGNPRNTMDSAFTSTNTGKAFEVGYNALVRIESTVFKEYVNANEYSNTVTGEIYLPDVNLYLLANNLQGSAANLFSADTAIAEIAWIGGYITFAEFQSLQTIFNNYISKL